MLGELHDALPDASLEDDEGAHVLGLSAAVLRAYLALPGRPTLEQAESLFVLGIGPAEADRRLAAGAALDDVLSGR